MGDELNLGGLQRAEGGYQIKRNVNTTTPKTSDVNVDYGFSADSIGDIATFSTNPVKAAVSQMDLDYMFDLAGISKPSNSTKPLEKTLAFASEGAEYGVEYSPEDLNLARFMFDDRNWV